MVSLRNPDGVSTSMCGDGVKRLDVGDGVKKLGGNTDGAKRLYSTKTVKNKPGIDGNLPVKVL